MIPVNVIRETAQMIRDMLGDDFDAQTFTDTLDGETDVMDFIGKLIRAKTDADAMEAAMKEVAASYTARAKRFGAQSDAARKGIGQILDAMGERKVTHPLATISRTAPRLSLRITDERSIPSQLCKLVPDNAAIKAQLEAGETVPGAVLEPGEAGLTVRVK
jgi:hypothetical protein